MFQYRVGEKVYEEMITSRVQSIVLGKRRLLEYSSKILELETFQTHGRNKELIAISTEQSHLQCIRVKSQISRVDFYFQIRK